jgi:hypothetical protein
LNRKSTAIGDRSSRLHEISGLGPFYLTAELFWPAYFSSSLSLGIAIVTCKSPGQ